jgi:hypothetical protein
MDGDVKISSALPDIPPGVQFHLRDVAQFLEPLDQCRPPMPRPICEAQYSIDIRKLNREGGLRPGRCFGYTWTRLGEPFGEVRMTVQSDILFLLAKLPNDKVSEPKSVAQGVRVAWSPCRWGGQRPWFLCPVTSCRRRCAKIYLAEDFFACRRCLGLAYASQQEPVRQRGLMKAQNIRMRLGGSPSMIEKFPDRPKGMHEKTFQGLRAAHDRAADRCMAGLSRFLTGR